MYLSGATLVNANRIVSAGGAAVQFGASPNTLIVDPGAAFFGVIGGFAVGNTIDMTGLSQSVVQGDFKGIQYGANPVLTTTATQNEGTLQLQGTFAGEHFVFTADSSGTGTDVTVEEGAACYRSGTRIFTARGDIPIERLKIGDHVLTLARDFRQIRWIGRRHYLGLTAPADTDILPIRICQGALGERVPKRDLWVSPGHALYLDGVLIAARDLINGVSIVQEESVREIIYFHLEFDTHAMIFAEGALAESFVDDETRSLSDNAAEYHELYPGAHRGPAAHFAPRVEEGWQLERISRRLAMRAPGATLPCATDH